MVSCISQARSITEINTNNTFKLLLFEISNNTSRSSLESPTLEYVEKPVTATTRKRKQSGGEEQGINHYVIQFLVRFTLQILHCIGVPKKRQSSNGTYVALASEKSVSTANFNLTILHCLISVPILHFPVTSPAATHTPSLEATDDGMLFPSNESTTFSNRGMSRVSTLQLGIDATSQLAMFCQILGLIVLYTLSLYVQSFCLQHT